MLNSKGRLKAYGIATFFIAQELSYGFVSQVTILIFDLAYGLAYTIIYRTVTPTEGIEGDQNEMGFGQLVPLFLLLLPALAVGELYFEQHDEPSQVKHNPPDNSNASRSPSEAEQSNSALAQTPAASNQSTVLDAEKQTHNRKTNGEDPDPAPAVNKSPAMIRSTNPVTRLGELLESLNFTSSDPLRKDTGYGLRIAHDYQIEQSESHNHSPDNLRNPTDKPNQIAPDETTKTASTDSASTSSTKLGTSDSTQEAHSSSIPQRSSGTPTSRPVYANIHYHRILTCVFLFQFTFQLLFALALGGVFGEEGYLVASCFLVVLMAVAVFVVIDGTRQRSMEIKEANGKPGN